MKTLEQGYKVGQVRVPTLRFPEFNDAGNWDKTALNKLFTIGSGKDYKHLSTGDIPVYGSGGYMLSVNDYLYDGESVCIGRKGTIDKPIFLTGKFWTVDTLFYTHSFIKCLPKFIFYQFQKINWKNYNEAGGIPSLSKRTIDKIEILVPSCAEQKKIADFLSSLDSIISLQTQKIDALQQYKKGLMQKLFPAEGETVPELRFDKFADGWDIRNLGELVSIKTGKKNTQDKVPDGKYPFFVRSQQVENIDNYSFDGEAILTAGDGVGVGKVFHYINGKFDYHQRVYCLSDFRSSVFGKYIYEVFKNNFGMETAKYSAKNSVDSVRMEMITGMKIPLPPLSEQQKIANCLSSLNERITAETQKLAALKTHKTGLMQQLFPAMDEVNA